MDKELRQLEVGGIIIKAKGPKIKHSQSIATKLSLSIVAIIITIVVLILIANSLFLGDYYASKNKTIFYQEYEEIQSVFEIPNQDILEILREKDKTTGSLFYIIEKSDPFFFRIVLSSIPNFLAIEPPSPNQRFMEPPLVELPGEQFEFIKDNIDSIDSGEPLFARVHRQMSGDNEFDLVFASKLDSNYYLVIVRPVEQLDELTSITNQFLLIIGLLSILLSIVISRISASSIVKPIKEITKISGYIANLDFTHKYNGHSHDEIETLGNSINKISSQLDSYMKELEDANKKLKIEMALQKRFFAGVSHEFKTPIGLIRGYSESLELGLAKSPEEIAEFSHIILDETDRLNHFVSDILFLVKSESTEFVLNFKTFDLINLLENIVEKNSNIISNKHIIFLKKLPQSVSIHADEIRISQIIENLLNNAIRHTKPNKKIILKVFLENNGVNIDIINEGKNIESKHLKNLFEPFYSAFESRDKTNSGTGLGLSIVRNLVDKHKGKCGIENINTPNFEGVKAFVWLPFLENMDN
ncbi:MAG: HAMP domain-containing sensor histidine kinase [Sphaerochaetaceae bacterium]|nr:HAMP domain-containing sensor histidine kinase [Sphaerochaetaceae bacterium]